MTFIRTLDDEFVRVGDVRSVKVLSIHVVLLTLENGDTKRCNQAAWTDAHDRDGRKFFPALAGSFLLHYGRTEGRVWVAREPILAWAVSQTGCVEPVSTSGVFRSDKSYRACLHPDGTVHDGMGLYETYDAWIAEVLADSV